MWFNPSELLIKEISPPATSATSATLEAESSKVARVAAPNNHTSVICYTPNGKAIEVEARDAEHVAFLIRMNPNPQPLNF